MNKRVLRLLGSLGLVALVLWLVGPTKVGAAFAGAEPAWLLAGFACAICASLCAALRWHSLAAWLGVAAPRGAMIVAQWRGITANALMPGGTLSGDALRAMHLAQAGHELIPSTASVVLDRLSGLWVLATMSLSATALALSLGLLPAGRLPVSALAATLLAVALLLAPLLLWQLSAGTRHRLPARLASLLDTVHDHPRPFREYLAQLAWSSAVQVACILAFSCGGWAVGLTLPYWQFLIVAGPIFIFAALPVSVGGWGTREAAAAVTLGLLGVPTELAVATAVLYGLFATLQGILGAATLLKPANP
ncbi:MAG TPA: lysylphosphatidylglycerol synthase transmembrane domain-containing protein [Rhodocyclaceae bacterium]|nr:lysylphosphatidylglycerol synthase transmembrane domain-containing protein [Rhodocyclaceae bacterium]